MQKECFSVSMWGSSVEGQFQHHYNVYNVWTVLLHHYRSYTILLRLLRSFQHVISCIWYVITACSVKLPAKLECLLHWATAWVGAAAGPRQGVRAWGENTCPPVRGLALSVLFLWERVMLSCQKDAGEPSITVSASTPSAKDLHNIEGWTRALFPEILR